LRPLHEIRIQDLLPALVLRVLRFRRKEVRNLHPVQLLALRFQLSHNQTFSICPIRMSRMSQVTTAQYPFEVLFTFPSIIL
jgi:hypothetical protein